MAKLNLEPIVSLMDLPEKIQKCLTDEVTENFIAALKTTFKPNATIPILWLVVHKQGLIFCNTHKTRGIFKVIPVGGIDSIKIHKGSQLYASKIEIILSDIHEDNFMFTISSDFDLDNLSEILTDLNYQVV